MPMNEPDEFAVLEGAVRLATEELRRATQDLREATSGTENAEMADELRRRIGKT